MSNFVFEFRCLIFKLTDIAKYLTDAESDILKILQDKINRSRHKDDKKCAEGIFIESDWGCYKSALKLLKSDHQKMNPNAFKMRRWNAENTEKYSKNEHEKTNPVANEILLWNRGNEEKYTKAEHRKTNPDSAEMCWWNESEKEKYTKSEHKKMRPDAEDMQLWNLNNNNEKYTQKEMENAR